MIWHTAEQKPKPNKIILVHYRNVDFYGVYGTMPGTEIVPNCNKWCYLNELLDCERKLDVAINALNDARINLAAIQPYLGDEYILDCKQDGLKAIDDAFETIGEHNAKINS